MRPAGDAVASFAQERMWILEQLLRGRSEYNSYSVARLSGQLDVEALCAAFGTVVRRHEVLRTVFEDVDGSPVPRLCPPSDVVVEFRDLMDGPGPLEGSREQAAMDLASQITRTPIDLAVGPVFRATLIRVADVRWLLIVVIHHVATDGWSMRLLWEEVSAAYTGRPLPGLSVQYADFAAWQRQRFTPDRLEPHVRYWRDRLADSSPVELPSERPRPAILSGEGQRLEFTLPLRVCAALRDLARSCRSTLFMVLLAGFQTALSRFVGLDDIVVGVPTAGRGEPEVESLIGFFVNTLVVRTGFGDDPSFTDVVARVRDGILDGFAHQDMPFEALLEALQPDRDLSRSPLFQIMFAMDEDDLAALHLPGVAIERVRLPTVRARLDLNLAMADEGSALRGEAVFAPDAVDQAVVERLVDAYLAVLNQASTNPAIRISALDVLSPQERRQVVQEYNTTHAEFPEGSCLHELFAEQARRTPDAVAVISGTAHTTYAELDRRSSALAEALALLGVRPDVPVGVWLERSTAMVVALLAVLKAGGAYVPLDPGVPVARCRQILSEAAASVVVADTARCEAAAGDGMSVVVADEAEETSPYAAPRAEASGPTPSPNNLVSIYYTSGSTGIPKGVASTHRGWVNRMWWMQQYYGLRPGEAVLQKTVISFDDAAEEIFWPLLAGGTVVLLAPGLQRDPRAIIDALIEHRISTVLFVPSMLSLVLEELTDDDVRVLTRLRHVISDGDRLASQTIRIFFDRLAPAGCRLFNQWGTTETSIDSVVHMCRSDDADLPAVPIGLPIANTQVYLLDRLLQPVPVGVVGDLYIGGMGLARGYWQDPAKTAGAFIPDPFGSGGRLYRTGDIGKRRADGELLILGRADHQVKIRGIRIEPAEIELVLRAFPEVAEAMVVKWEPTVGDHRLAAYLTIADGHEPPDRIRLRAAVARALPSSMVPAAYTFLDEIPRTAAGKTDRRRLPTPKADALAVDTAPAAATPTEEVVCRVWSEVLGLPSVGVDQDFFALGGHSLLASKVVSRLRRRLSVDLPLSDMFNHPTVQALAARLDEGPVSAVRPTIEPVTSDPPLSFAQERLWLLDALFPDRPDYNISAAIRLQGRLDISALTAALGVVAERHRVLRSRVVVETDGVPRMRECVKDLQPVLTDLSELAPDKVQNECMRVVQAEADTCFDLARGPFARFHLLRLSEAEWVLVAVIHHIAADGWSMRLLWEELSAAYTALRADRPVTLPYLPVQYGDYAAWQRLWYSGDRLEPHVHYWKSRLSGAEPTELPTDRPRPVMLSGRGARLRFEVPPAVAARLGTVARQSRASLFTVLLAGFQVVLSRFSGLDDIVVGVPVAGRHEPEVEPLIGFFVNTLVIRADLSGDPTLAEAAGRVRETVLAAFAHQDLPFGRLVAELQPERDLSRNPLFQIMFAVNEFALDERVAAAVDLPGIASEPYPLEAHWTKLDLDVVLVDRLDGIDGVMYYSTDLFTEPTVRSLADCYVSTLELLVSAADRRLSEVEILPPAQRLPPGRPVRYQGPGFLEAFAEQVRRNPGAIAVLSGGERLTYGGLDARSNRLARMLRERGVQGEQAVGIMMDRTPDLLAVLLAVLKAGGFYVPVDRSYPATRIDYMLTDTRVACVLTNKATVSEIPVGLREQAIAVDELPSTGSPRSFTNADRPGAALAYCIHTSGSTGKPKAVMVTRDALANLLHDMAERISITPGDVVAAITTVSFDIAALELFAPLWCGATVLLVDSDTVRDPEALALVLREGGATVVQATPTAWSLLLRAGWNGPGTRVLCGGEAMSGDLGWRLSQVAGEVWNVYGPTETTIWSTATRVGSGGSGKLVPIGEPIAGTTALILDEHLQVLPNGAIGELAIGGAGVARGYLGNPADTADRFVPDPRLAGGRLYRTGDLARRGPGGVLEFFGRKDLQVKVRGHRIEPGEVESAMTAHPAVASAVAAMAGEGEDARLVAYVSWRDDPKPAPLIEYLRSVVPAFMVPSLVITVDAMPLTPNGKINRRKLSQFVAETPAQAWKAPRDLLELRVLRIWEKVLGVRGLGVDQDFFAVGGHSVAAFRLVAATRRELGIAVPLKTLFLNPTVERFCAALPTTPDRLAELTVPLTETVEDGAPLFLVHPHGGDVSCYLHLARALASEPGGHLLPIVGIEAVGYNTDEAPLNDIGAMADRYIREIQARAPKGPYRLAGWSFGGNVVFEIAARLEHAGRDVGFLGLIDAEAFGARPQQPPPESEKYARLADLAGLDPASLAGLDEQAAIEAALHAHRSAGSLLPRRLEAAALRRMVAVSAANTRAALGYRQSAAIRADIYLFAASEPHPTRPSPTVVAADWSRRTRGRLHVVPVPGNHFDVVFPPHSSDLAAALQRALVDGSGATAARDWKGRPRC